MFLNGKRGTYDEIIVHSRQVDGIVHADEKEEKSKSSIISVMFNPLPFYHFVITKPKSRFHLTSGEMFVTMESFFFCVF